MFGELPFAIWSCAVCGSTNETPVDTDLGARQEFTEDCVVCCRPNFLRITLSEDNDLSVEVSFDE